MGRTGPQPAWQRNAIWLSALLLAAITAAGVLMVSLSQLSSEGPGVSVQRAALRLTLWPTGEGVALAARTGSAYTPGAPLAVVPGVDVTLPAAELAGATPESALDQVAWAFTDDLVAGGEAALLRKVGNASLSRQLERAMTTTARGLVLLALEAQLLQTGIGNGSRLADWPAQAAAEPGQPVQPIVGVFVRVPPERLAGRDARGIGQEVVAELTNVIMSGGLPAAEELVGNDELRGSLVAAVNGDVRTALHDLFAVMLEGYAGEVGDRLAEARAVQVGGGDTAENLGGLLSATELADLSAEEADEALLAAFAERSWAGGALRATALLTQVEQAAKVEAVAPLLDTFGSAAHRRYVVWAWALGLAGLFLLVVLAGLSGGLAKLANPGVAVLAGASAGAYLINLATSSLPRVQALPESAVAQGVFGAIWSLTAFAVGALPAAVTEWPYRNYLVAACVGGGLLVVAVLVLLLRGERGSGRRRL